jgi:fructose 1,6-bisphosphatase
LFFFTGDKSLLPGYVHSITSTENFVIMPITSLLINPCKFKEPPRSGPLGSHIQNGGLWGMDFYDMVPMRFVCCPITMRI